MLPLIVANRAQDALGSDANEVTLLDDAGAHSLPKMDKLSLARRLVTEIARRLNKALRITLPEDAKDRSFRATQIRTKRLVPVRGSQPQETWPNIGC